VRAEIRSTSETSAIFCKAVKNSSFSRFLRV